MSKMGLPKTRYIRERLRKEAEERQAEYDKLSVQEKLDRLPPEPACKRQRDRLTQLLNKPTATAEAPASPAKAKSLKAKERRSQEQ